MLSFLPLIHHLYCHISSLFASSIAVERSTSILFLLTLSFLAIVHSCKAASTVQQAAYAIPSCIQPRSSADPSPSYIANVLDSDHAASNACNTKLQGVSVRPTNNTFYSDGTGFYFNTSSTIGIGSPSGSACTEIFQLLLTVCIRGLVSFWGGWVVENGVNYSSKRYSSSVHLRRSFVYYSKLFALSSQSSTSGQFLRGTTIRRYRPY